MSAGVALSEPIRPGWEHKVEDSSHPADPHYPSGGVVPSTGKPVVGNKFVCSTCRELVVYVGQRVAITGGVAVELLPDEAPGGLESDGS